MLPVLRGSLMSPEQLCCPRPLPRVLVLQNGRDEPEDGRVGAELGCLSNLKPLGGVARQRGGNLPRLLPSTSASSSPLASFPH